MKKIWVAIVAAIAMLIPTAVAVAPAQAQIAAETCRTNPSAWLQASFGSAPKHYKTVTFGGHTNYTAKGFNYRFERYDVRLVGIYNHGGPWYGTTMPRSHYLARGYTYTVTWKWGKYSAGRKLSTLTCTDRFYLN